MIKHRILVVDDSTLMRAFIKDSVSEEFPDIEIVEAGNGKEAMHKLEKSRFDFILCDWEMPEMSGSELLEWIRNNPSTKKMHFIMVTARSEKEFVVEAIKLGVNDYVVKPPTGEVLIQRVKAALQKIAKSG